MIVRCPLDGAQIMVERDGTDYHGICGCCGFRFLGQAPPLRIGDKTWHPETKDWR
jgi:hypothetical protein